MMDRNMHHPNCGCGCSGRKPQYVQPIAQQPYPVQPIANLPIANQPIAHQSHRMPPIVCPPLCRYTDSYTEREVPVIQPLININRQHIVDVPKTYYEEINENVVVSPYQDRNPYGNPGNPYGGRGRNRYPHC